jgi:hypothetical protein
MLMALRGCDHVPTPRRTSSYDGVSAAIRWPRRDAARGCRRASYQGCVRGLPRSRVGALLGADRPAQPARWPGPTQLRCDCIEAGVLGGERGVSVVGEIPGQLE